MTKKTKSGFTLIELVVTIAIIGILLTISAISFSNIRQKARDAKRVSDITQIQNTLSLYLRDEGQYPASLTFGNALIGSSSSSTYMTILPNNPTPRNDGACPDSEYLYQKSATGTDYKIDFCLAESTAQLNAGNKCATSKGIINGTCESTNAYVLTYTAGANGSITGTSTQTVSSGADGSAVTAVGDAGYSFIDWSDSSTANPRTDINVTDNISVTANFIDTDVLNFINAVATLTDGQEDIINTLVTDLKTAGLWTKMDIIYPFIGGTAATHKYNLKAPADYQITWNGVWTHDANGAVSDGAASSYGTTGWNPLSLSKNINDFHLSFYNRNGVYETNVGGRGSLGWYAANTGFCLLSNRASYGTLSIIGTDAAWAAKSTIPLNGLITGSRISSTDNRVYQNNTQRAISSITNSNNFTNHSVEIGRVTTAVGSAQPFAFASVGTGLTSTDVSNLYTLIQAYQTSLSRQVP